CFSTLMIACVPARFPELNKTMTRSPGRSKTVILQNFAKLSTPAWVRESDAKMIPSSTRTPTQYVMSITFLGPVERPGLAADRRRAANQEFGSNVPDGGLRPI